MAGPDLIPLVLHVDMDAFFAGVEIRSDPRLRDRPLAVGGGPGNRGVVTAASYPAREFGIRSGMAMVEARRRCPGLQVVPVDPAKMIHESIQILSILDRFSPTVEPASIDEAYLSFPPQSRWEWKSVARSLASRIQTIILMERGLTASVGVGINKLQAKMASGLDKPKGISIVPHGDFLSVFGYEPVRKLPGVGPETEKILCKAGLDKISILAATEPGRLTQLFGEGGCRLHDLANGRSKSDITPAGFEAPAKSASHEMTFSRDVDEDRVLRAAVWLLADRVARRLRRSGCSAHTVAVRYFAEGRSSSRQRKLEAPTDDPSRLARHAWSLLFQSRSEKPFRRIGVAASHLGQDLGSLPLFSDEEKRRQVVRAGDSLRDRFGEHVFLPGQVYRGKSNVNRKKLDSFRAPRVGGTQ